MIKKNGGRQQSSIYRQSDSQDDEDHWLKQFENNLAKSAVQSRQVDQSLFDQINSIMNGSKSKYTSVADAVEQMKERSGLNQYLKNSEIVENNKKKASSTDKNQAIDKKVDLTPIVIKKKPQILNTLQNYINDSKGNLAIPAIISKIQSIHSSDVSEARDWEDENLIRLISKLNLEAKRNNPANYENYNNLGKRDYTNDSDIDPSNLDAFHGLTPAKI